MARLDFENIEKEKGFASDNEVSPPVYTKYTVATYAGEKYIRINMYGSKDRKYTGKVSQCIHINKNDAIEFIALLKDCFNIVE